MIAIAAAAEVTLERTALDRGHRQTDCISLAHDLDLDLDLQ